MLESGVPLREHLGCQKVNKSEGRSTRETQPKPHPDNERTSFDELGLDIRIISRLR